ncbi:MAG: relaxase/mobilization nuclease domain-containing protein [Oscillibacter sp.]|nr:relaxase/mobilization nuclease domain-containing protein [Oscillibacter sp.]
MAVTKILARSASPEAGIRYILNEKKTDGKILVATNRCSADHAATRMMKTKRHYNRTGGVQYFHMILSFKPGEVTPEKALEIAKEFMEEQLSDYETVAAVHTDRQHIHVHLIFNSVNAKTGEKYHSNSKTYYSQIRSKMDQLCRKHGLSVIEETEQAHSVSYIEWLRQSRGQPTFRSMLEADIRTAIEDANSLGEFYMLMEHLGYEIKHGNRLSFRLRGQERYMVPGRKNPLFTEDGILAAIQGNLDDIEAGRRPAVVYRPPYRPYRKYQKYTGFMALYVRYLYILGKIEKRQYPPRMTAQIRKDVMKLDQLRTHFAFLRDNDITTPEAMAAYIARTEETLAGLTKERTILNVRKKKRRKLYSALADVSTLAEVKSLCEDGVTGMEAEYARYIQAVRVLEKSGVPRERLTAEKAELYEKLAQLNRQIRAERKKLAMCKEIQAKMTQMERDIQKTDPERVNPARSTDKGKMR